LTRHTWVETTIGQRMRLLRVEDDAMIGDTVVTLLRTDHYAVDWVRDGVLSQ
jgi:two-component system OmpR family response regulator